MTLSSLEIEALQLSLQVALCAVGVSLPLGIGVAWVLSRKPFPGRIVLDGFVHLPLILPPVVVGYLLLMVMGRRGFVGAWLWDTFQISIAFSLQARLQQVLWHFPCWSDPFARDWKPWTQN